MKKKISASGRRRESTGRMLLRWVLGVALVVALVWVGWLYVQIDAVAERDEARPADAIAVFGAAEYLGRPSPVLHARLDHAVELYREGMAPVVITLGGGSDKDQGMTEGGVGRDYLLANGIPYERIIAETHSVDTEEQVAKLAEIARRRHLNSLVVVSDGTHLFRVKKMCEDAGLIVYTSPRPVLGHIDAYDMAARYFHEMLGYTLLRLHLNFAWTHGKADA
ncbi:MAG TPA: YdcF family protein [Acidobacteriaceae bacterium]|nr:YdcF family protein [Acidobacteriaceae bacterium]